MEQVLWSLEIRFGSSSLTMSYQWVLKMHERVVRLLKASHDSRVMQHLRSFALNRRKCQGKNVGGRAILAPVYPDFQAVGFKEVTKAKARRAFLAFS